MQCFMMFIICYEERNGGDICEVVCQMRDEVKDSSAEEIRDFLIIK